MKTVFCNDTGESVSVIVKDSDGFGWDIVRVVKPGEFVVLEQYESIVIDTYTDETKKRLPCRTEMPELFPTSAILAQNRP